MLTDDDHRLLDTLGLPWSAVTEGGWLTLIVSDWPLPSGYDAVSADLMLRIPPGYPDMPLDMWYFSPAVGRTDGADIEQTQVRENFSGREWQRWSRHLSPGDWKPGMDGLRSYVARLRGELLRSSGQVAA
jgi:hypothetical protein